MRALALSLIFMSLAIVPVWAEEGTAACMARATELRKQADAFIGDARTKRLIDADLKRAKQEAAEGDADECTEALDHSVKLLAGGA